MEYQRPFQPAYPLLNNGGGEIFHTLPGLDMSGTSHKFIAAVHKTSAKGWAEERGFLYLQAQMMKS